MFKYFSQLLYYTIYHETYTFSDTTRVTVSDKLIKVFGQNRVANTIPEPTRGVIQPTRDIIPEPTRDI